MQMTQYQPLAASLSTYAGQREVYEARLDSEEPWPYLFEPELSLAAHGLCGEFLAEVEPLLTKLEWRTTEELVLELGDFYWYMALFATANGVTLPDTPPSLNSRNRTLFMADFRKELGKATEMAKKIVHHKREYPAAEIVEQSIRLWTYGHMLALRLRLDPGEVMQKNINKLEKRFNRKAVA